MEGTSASSVKHDSSDQAVGGEVGAADGAFFIAFTAPLGEYFKLSGDVPLVWAAGTSPWSAGLGSGPAPKDMHSLYSRRATLIDLKTGRARLARVSAMWLAHGALMAAAWLVLAPAAVAAVRYTRHGLLG